MNEHTNPRKQRHNSERLLVNTAGRALQRPFKIQKKSFTCKKMTSTKQNLLFRGMLGVPLNLNVVVDFLTPTEWP